MLSNYVRFLLFLAIIQVHTQQASLNELCDVIKNNPSTCAKATGKAVVLVPLLSIWAACFTVITGFSVCETYNAYHGSSATRDDVLQKVAESLVSAALTAGCCVLIKKCVQSVEEDMRVLSECEVTSQRANQLPLPVDTIPVKSERMKQCSLDRHLHR